jgi:hypothetical protein
VTLARIAARIGITNHARVTTKRETLT